MSKCYNIFGHQTPLRRLIVFAIIVIALVAAIFGAVAVYDAVTDDTPVTDTVTGMPGTLDDTGLLGQ